MDKFITILIIFLSVLVSCTKDKTTGDCSGDCIPNLVSYETDIKPLISQSCATNQGPGTGCHDAWIFNYGSVSLRVKDGTFRRVILDEKSMPPIPNNFNIQPLTEAELKLFECWICDGGPNN